MFDESFTREELKRMLRWYFDHCAPGETERHTLEETELEELAEMADSYLSNGHSDGKPTKLETMAAAVVLEEWPSISTHPILECPITLFAIPHGRWVECHIEERYWEVTPSHAAMLFEGAGLLLSPPGGIPPELEPYRDSWKVSKEVFDREDAESDSDSPYLNPYAPIRKIDQPPLDEASQAATPSGNGTAATEAPAELTPPAPQSETVENRALAMALRMITSGEKLSIVMIAKTLGCQRSFLYRCPKFQAFIKAQKNGRESLPRGRKDRKTRELEAWDGGD